MKKIITVTSLLALGISAGFTSSLSIAKPVMAAKESSKFGALKFRNLGPNRGGRVTAVAGTVAAPSTFYLGASGGGVWKTEDYGTSWKNVSDGFFKTPSIGDIAVAQNDANIIYVGTGSDGLRSNVIRGKGLYKSIDGGKTWDHMGLDNTGHIGAVEIDPTNHNVAYVAAIGQAHDKNKERGVYKTTDGGKTWKKVLFISDEVGISDVELLPGNPNIVFATAWKAKRTPWTIISGGEVSKNEAGIYKSVDGGNNWEKITKGLPTGLMGKTDLATSPADSSIVVALVEAPSPKGGLYKSVDQGKSFKQVSSHKGIQARPFYYSNVDLDPKNPDIVYVSTTGYFKSTNGGKTWDRLKPPHGDNHDMWINPNNPDLFIQANDGGANVTHNGGKTWSTQFNQPTAELYQVDVDDRYPYWLYAGQQDNGTTIAVPSKAPYAVQDRARWIEHTGGCETGPGVPKPGNHNIVYANCKGRFGVYDKTTGQEKAYYVGATNIYGHNPKNLKYRFQRVAPIHVSPHNADVVYHASQYVHRTKDDGITWETISPDLTAFEAERQVISGSPITRDITGEEYYSAIYSIQESKIKAGLIWVGSNDGVVSLTQDNGKTWDRVTPKGLLKGGRVDSIEPSTHNPAHAYASILRFQVGDWKPYIYKTENYGKKWTLLTNGKNGIPADYPVRVMRSDPGKEGVLYAGTEFGLFISLNDGKTWESFNQNVPITPITDIKVYREDLVLSTMGRGFWVLDNVTSLHQDGIGVKSTKAKLFKPKDTIRFRQPSGMRGSGGGVPNYPRPNVVIDYSLPDGFKGKVQLDILDTSGNTVNSYVNGGKQVKPSSSTDMGTGQTVHIVSKNLKTKAGLNRFGWDMSHTGPWNKNKTRRYTGGIMAKPGTYTARLTVGGKSSDQSFNLVINPNVAKAGLTVGDIAAQEAFGLKVSKLLNDVNKLEASLVKQAKELTKSKKDPAKLAKVKSALSIVKTPSDMIYPRNLLASQIGYLFNMTNGADQITGKDTAKRYDELKASYDAVVASLK
jgi:photosystem II stability/assembly factor-like uncharacterized protein